MYALVFVTRYLDLFWNFDYYLTTMKVIYISATFYIMYLMRYKFRASYDKEHDSFRVIFLIAPCAILSLIINQELSLSEVSLHPKKKNLYFQKVLWTFSIYLEAVAIFPQLVLLQRTNEVENITADYIFCLGAYRTLYLINWIYRYFTEDDYSQWIVWISGLIQTALYIDFFYYYVMRYLFLKSISNDCSKYYGKKMVLP